MADFPDLWALDLSHNPRITDAALRHLKPLKNLHWLALHATSITDKGLSELVALPSLEDVNIAQTAVTDAGVESLVRIKTLRRLLLPDGVTEAGIERLRAETEIDLLGR